jgi:CRP/FNR family cyclic AMP-dependent transcriptional regulator
MVSTTAAAISTIPLFTGLEAAQLAQLASLMQVRTLAAGAHLIMEDTRGEVTFVIQRGAVKIRVSDLEGTEVILAILGPGEVVGEMSLVDALQRSASAVTMEPIVCGPCRR